MASKKSVKLALSIWDAGAYVNEEIGLIKWDKNKAAHIIDTALAEARLEGARAMQAKADTAEVPVPTELTSMRCDLNVFKAGIQGALNYFRALDPQQVINERIK